MTNRRWLEPDNRYNVMSMLELIGITNFAGHLSERVVCWDDTAVLGRILGFKSETLTKHAH